MSAKTTVELAVTWYPVLVAPAKSLKFRYTIPTPQLFVWNERATLTPGVVDVATTLVADAPDVNVHAVDEATICTFVRGSGKEAPKVGRVIV